MTVSSMLLIGLAPGERDVAVEAARRVFPDALVTDLKSLDDFLRSSRRFENGLVVIGSGTADQIATAVRATDASGLPGWAVVVVGEPSNEEWSESVPRREWTVESASRIIQSAVTLHAAKRENARLRGDLKTVATRFSHDVRSPLGAILTTCELIRELGEAPDTTLLSAITDSADEVSLLITRMTAILRATADPKPAEAFDMGDAVFRALQRIQYECHKRKASVVVPEKWPTINGVQKNLEIVWDCLLANAMKYGGDSPQIRIAWTRAQHEYEFWIEDGGTTPPGMHDKMFLPFHTLHEQNDGGGLDLSIVERIVEIHGGRCGFMPLVESGSRFYFALPAIEELAVEQTSASGTPDAQSSRS